MQQKYKSHLTVLQTFLEVTLNIVKQKGKIKFNIRFY